MHLVQMWVVPAETGIRPGYEQLDVNERLDAGGLVPVASGRGHEGAITIHQPGAVMWVGRLGDGETVALPDAPYVHLFVARGSVSLGSDTLVEGDAARLTAAGAVDVTGIDGAEIIVWESDSDSGR